MNLDVSFGYQTEHPETSSVAIVGAREFIFSQNIGILGDIAAAKEQTFGTLFARTMGEIGSKLHYGHPDLLNGIFMTTRGGISKAQRGLHLNEDIYANTPIHKDMENNRLLNFNFGKLLENTVLKLPGGLMAKNKNVRTDKHIRIAATTVPFLEYLSHFKSPRL